MTTWLFQVNPSTFDADAYLAKARSIRWTVRQQHFADQMMPGDRVFIWRAEGDKKVPGGAVAAGYLSNSPAEEPEDAAALPFWVEPPIGSALRVRATIDRVADAKEVLKRAWLKDDPVLGGMQILKVSNGTNYKLTPDEAQRLEVLWQNTGRDWSKAESMAGLWAYAHTFGREVSRGASSPVSEVALRIGRAVTGVYNKVMNYRAIDPRDPREGLSGGSAIDRQVWQKYFDAASNTLDQVRLDADFARQWPPGSTGVASTSAASPPVGSATEPGTARGQGYESNPLVRSAIELHAMKLAEEHYKAKEFVVTVTAATQPYDLSCTKGSREVRVEVKGTRGDGSTIEVTIGEVNNARGSGRRTDLFIVSGIIIDRAEEPVARGGSVRIVEDWHPSDANLSPIRFRCTLPG